MSSDPSAMADLETEALKTMIVNGNFKLAVQLFTRAISLSLENNAELFVERSHANFELGKFAESLTDAERAISLDPSMYMAYFRKGEACYQLEDYGTAKRALEFGSCQVPENAIFMKWIKQCDELIADACQMEITGSTSETPSDSSSKQQRENRDKLGADEFPQRENLADPSATANLETQALKAFISRDFTLARMLFTRAMSTSPDNAELYAGRSRTHFKLGMFSESLADAERAIGLDSSMHMAYFHKGKACYQLKDYRTAKAAFESGSFRVPGNGRFINLIRRCDERIAGTGCQRPLNPTPKRQRIETDEVEFEKSKENREKLGADAFQENREKLGADAFQENRENLSGGALPPRRARRRRWQGDGSLEKSQHD